MTIFGKSMKDLVNDFQPRFLNKGYYDDNFSVIPSL